MPRVPIRQSARRVLVRATKRVGRRLGLFVSETGTYSPVPESVPPPADPVWARELPGVELDTAAQRQLIEAELAPYLDEFAREVRGRGFELWNGLYQAGDAELLYSLLRHLKPRRVLEIGSGYSTEVSAAACLANAWDGSPAELVAVDPQPPERLADGLEGLTRLERLDCRQLPLERFLGLEPGDVLFIDSSHVVKLGSEVNWLVLEVLPRLRAGVWVHFHDVFLPYEYPHYLFAAGGYFNEQYLVYAFLLGNGDWEVMLAACALARRHPERLRELIPSLAEEPPGMAGFPYVPAAFWLRRRG